MDQEARFAEFIAATGHTRVDQEAEEVSGGKNTRTPRFQAMLDRMPLVGAEAVVCDSLDRFSRDAFDGPTVVTRLQAMGVALWELEHSWERPFDLRDPRDRGYVLDKFRAAESERDRITKRTKKRYAEQRRRGATCTNRPAFGLTLAGDQKGHRRIVADPATARSGSDGNSWRIADGGHQIRARHSRCVAQQARAHSRATERSVRRSGRPRR
jgi:DNA invertase Pin-like site-specific DNA recombinase